MNYAHRRLVGACHLPAGQIKSILNGSPQSIMNIVILEIDDAVAGRLGDVCY